jgi:hypothetical protein
VSDACAMLLTCACYNLSYITGTRLSVELIAHSGYVLSDGNIVLLYVSICIVCIFLYVNLSLFHTKRLKAVE